MILNLQTTVTTICYCGILLIGQICFPTFAVGQELALETSVLDILSRNCAGCHQDSDEGGFDYVTDLEMLIERKKIKAKDLEGSRIWARINDAEDPMPPADETDRPTKAEIAILKQYIMSLGDQPSETSPENKEPEISVEKRNRVDNELVIFSIHQHLSNMDKEDRVFQRYFVLHHLHNMPLPEKPSDRRGVSNEYLNLVRAATSKTMNSLTWTPAITVPRAVDKDKTVLAIDLRDFDWDRNHKLGRPDLWNIMVRDYPYGLKHHQYPDNIASSRQAKEIYEWTGIDLPWVRADWFVATASQPQNYHALLYDAVFEDLRMRAPIEVKFADGLTRIEQPMTQDDLFEWLRVDLVGNLRRGKAARAAFTRSGVSSQPRMVERHPALYGSLWNSYDMVRGNLSMNLPARALGPDGIFDAEKFGRYSFQHDGGEMIYGLPNGLHGYLLVNQKGNRIPDGPQNVVKDTNEILGNPIIVSAVSCIACHKSGLITDFSDEVRFGLRDMQADARRIARKLYLDRPELDELINTDQDRYRAAYLKTVAPFLDAKKVAQMKTGGALTEPVGIVTKRFIVNTIDALQMATELEVEVKELEMAVQYNEKLRDLGLGVVARGGTTSREVWQSGAGRSAFQRAALILKKGSPVSITPAPWRGR